MNRIGKGTNLPPIGEIRPPKPHSRKRLALQMLLRKQGATLLELCAEFQLTVQNVRVLLHDINRKNGYGIETIAYTPGNPRYKAYKKGAKK